MEPHPFLTADGSHSLRSDRFAVAYHSTHGALQESRHIFLEAGLHPLLTAADTTAVHVLELGFGTGLNALLVRELAARHPGIHFRYLTYEAFPITPHLAAELNYCELLAVPSDRLAELHTADWDTEARLDPNFTFQKKREDFLTADFEPGWADVLFYDAFAPEDQPELWTQDAMQHCTRALRPGGALVTYCAKGQFKRNLRAAGFRVEALPGPVGKREITRAYHVDLS
ncbi:tRNA (5-methylaminomethyl-2-thiouridine)(34)-methyltransferase MnmD [Lewinella sp. IMCC34183]|uniref:tRNA (5-methylaminomethyl-2-thiouridine)(34)-methyltransferase MnmD n=1 Tax=Lewinella sp. IMCC34183 TaxID=2248762 RepID=UPI000E25521E|nr:tRNA (5-methylaminomethyl-2-thiouridine)(34)-methyltransferase MnmD [Lewinella sp. IMCC34183]